MILGKTSTSYFKFLDSATNLIKTIVIRLVFYAHSSSPRRLVRCGPNKCENFCQSSLFAKNQRSFVLLHLPFPIICLRVVTQGYDRIESVPGWQFGGEMQFPLPKVPLNLAIAESAEALTALKWECLLKPKASKVGTKVRSGDDMDF